MKIVCIKCVTGEMVVAKQEESIDVRFASTSIGPTRKKYVDIRVVGLLQDSQGNIRIQCGPWVAFNQNIELTEEQWERMTLVEFPADENVTRTYLQNTSRIALS